MKAICLVCSGEFITYPSRIKIGWGKYCSNRCNNTINGFKEGVGYWNGKKRPDLVNTKARETMFIKGQISWNKGVKNSTNPVKSVRHYKWSGSNVGYSGLHKWVRRMLGAPKFCELCKTINPKTKYHWANKDGKYQRNLSEWFRLCALCHKRYDIIIARKVVMPYDYVPR